MHENEVSGRVKEGETDKCEIVVEAVEGSWDKVEDQHLLILDDSLSQRHDCIVSHIDGAAEQELEDLCDQNN